MGSDRVLVTDGLWRKVVSAVRALGRKSLNVTVQGDSVVTTSFFSRYCRERLICPCAKDNEELFLKSIVSELKKHRYGLLIPMEDETIALCAKNKHLLSELVPLPIPDKESLDVAMDKGKTLKLAEELGGPIPKGYLISKYENKDLEKAFLENTWVVDQVRKDQDKTELSQVLDFPLAVKPTVGCGSRGFKIVNNKQQLEVHIKHLRKQGKEVLVQERLDGDGYGVGMLCGYDSEPVAAFTYKRLREYPVGGGPSTLRESVNYPELVEYTATLLKELKWCGVAMVEFKMDNRDGVPKLMEINPRFWGSIELAIASGVNFPVLLYKIANGIKFDPVFDYKVGVRCRWMVPGDFLHFLTNPKRFQIKPGFFDFASDDCYDLLSWEDPMPVFGAGLAMVYNAFRPSMWNVFFRK